MILSRNAVMLQPVALLSTCLLGLVGLSQAATTPAPISLPPSQYYEGNDGKWSTFAFRFGSNAQQIRALISTQFPNAVVKINTTCDDGNDSPCANSMGKTFAPNSSTTYKQKGIFNLYAELNYTLPQDRGIYGFDTVGFGYNSDGGPALDQQIIASTNTIDYYFGMLGVNPQPTNFTDFSHPTKSLFQTLKDKNMIPSLSYSYTAGAVYRFKQVTGSFVFGGYDSSRVTTNSLDFTMADDVTRDLVVGIQAINFEQKSGTSRPLLNDGVLALIDSSTPYIVLPPDACELFETAFNIVWDDDLGIYTVSNSVHNTLTSQDTNITFLIGNGESGGNTVSITLPYAAFDLEVTPDFTGDGSTQKYFPLQRAANETQYTLGRTFLQEAMLVANYEQGNFSIYQNKWIENAKATIEVIHPKGYQWPAAANNGNGSGNNVTSSTTSSNAAAIGGGVGGGVVALLAIFLLLAWFKRWWPFHNRRPSQAELDSKAIGFAPNAKAPLPQGDMHEAPDHKGYYGSELVGSDSAIHKSELPGSAGSPGAGKTELAAGGVYRPHDRQHGELVGDNGAREVEGDGGATEVPGSNIVMELEGAPVPDGWLTSPQRPGSSPRHPSPRDPLMGGNSRQNSLGPGHPSPMGGERSPRDPRDKPLPGSPSPLSASGGFRTPDEIPGQHHSSFPFLGSPTSMDSESRAGSRGRLSATSGSRSRQASRRGSERSYDGRPPNGGQMRGADGGFF